MSTTPPNKRRAKTTTRTASRRGAAVRLTGKRYQEMFHLLAEGVVMVSATGKILAANPSAQALLGMTARQMEVALRDDQRWRAQREDGSPYAPEQFPIRSTLRTGKPRQAVVMGLHLPRQGLRWMSVNTRPVFAGRRKTPNAVVVSFEDITRAKEAETGLARLAAAIQASPDAITSIDRNDQYVSWNPGAERLFGYSAGEALGHKPGWTIPNVGKRDELPDIRRRAFAGETITGWETQRIRKDGQRLFIQSNYAPIRDARGNVDGVVGVHRDVSQLKHMLMQIESSKELFRLALDGIPDVFVIYDAELRIRFVNERGLKFFDRSAEQIIGKRDQDLLPPEVTATLAAALKRAQITRTTLSQESSFILRGQAFSISATYVPMVDDTGNIQQILGLLHDYTKRRQNEERLSFMAQFDALTGLPNRYLLLDRMEAAMQRAKRNNTLLGVMFLDIDRFKQINDTRGHAAGDILLQQIAERLARTLRATDTIARLGGDEFTVLVEDVTTVDEITAIADKIMHSFATSFATEVGEVFTTTSVGITVYPFDNHERDDLLKNADIAMYHAKQDRNNWQLYHAGMNANAAGRLGMELELRHALIRNEFELHYMPQVNIRTNALIGLEALIRWESKSLGRIAPVDFIPLAEDTGLIVPIGEWVLRAACEQCKAWERVGLSPFPVAVNISALQFRRVNLLQLVKGMLMEFHLDPSWLTLEITESSIMRHAEQTAKTLSELRELGVSIAIDDFGTGYSSLSYLKRFPVNKIKIDRSFVSDIDNDSNDAAIVSAVIAMSKQLGITTVAEGVETQAQLTFLSRLECDEYQGFLFHKPMPAAEVLPLIKTHQSKLARST